MIFIPIIITTILILYIYQLNLNIEISNYIINKNIITLDEYNNIINKLNDKIIISITKPIANTILGIIIIIFITIPIIMFIIKLFNYFKIKLKYINFSHNINKIYFYDKNKNRNFLNYIYNEEKLNENLFSKKEILKIKNIKSFQKNKTKQELIDMYIYRLDYLNDIKNQNITFDTILSILSILIGTIIQMYTNYFNINEPYLILYCFICISLLFIYLRISHIIDDVKLKNVRIYKNIEIKIINDILNKQ